MENNLNGKLVELGITYDDVLLIPAKSDVLPSQVDLKTRLTKNITLNIPFLSAAMDTVTESAMAIAIAKLGGAGIIHKNLSIEDQAKEVALVKAAEFENVDQMAVVDKQGRLIAGAAVGVSEETIARVDALVAAGLDFLVIDSAHGHSEGILNTVKAVKAKYPNLDVIPGNIATAEGAKDLVEAGADAVKVGIGPGSICTTRVVAGVGVPQMTALSNVYEYCKTVDIPFIADGGIKYSGDVVKALAVGSNVVMLGSMFAGCEETPGSEITIDGKTYKTYVGMGSMAAMKRGSSDRYFQKGNKKLVPEGIESMVDYKGPVADVIFQMIGGLRAGMGYTGSHNIDELRTDARFVQITNAGLNESHPHSVKNIQGAQTTKNNKK
ncbi:IMP dehydrogenase [[Acholeplasma] multilocale]|uniref:IMP dehydrogenase n=1 Tax=[Acholeplasma] multilocale TaxID=264638 RepID=UPI000415A60F|nr:IMP dehydrogenase [[Acholeplasma] multilocale]